jgi:hypothetical protein
MHGDDEPFGAVHRVTLFDRFPRRVRLTDDVSSMNRAATEDVRAPVWRIVSSVLRTGPAPNARDRRVPTCSTTGCDATPRAWTPTTGGSTTRQGRRSWTRSGLQLPRRSCGPSSAAWSTISTRCGVSTGRPASRTSTRTCARSFGARSADGSTSATAGAARCGLAGHRRRYARSPAAPWRSGYAAACKAVYTGSIPVGASQNPPQNGGFAVGTVRRGPNVVASLARNGRAPPPGPRPRSCLLSSGRALSRTAPPGILASRPGGSRRGERPTFRPLFLLGSGVNPE